MRSYVVKLGRPQQSNSSNMIVVVVYVTNSSLTVAGDGLNRRERAEVAWQH
jgi:hypothetical protein